MSLAFLIHLLKHGFTEGIQCASTEDGQHGLKRLKSSVEKRGSWKRPSLTIYKGGEVCNTTASSEEQALSEATGWHGLTKTKKAGEDLAIASVNAT